MVDMYCEPLVCCDRDLLVLMVYCWCTAYLTVLAAVPSLLASAAALEYLSSQPLPPQAGFIAALAASCGRIGRQRPDSTTSYTSLFTHLLQLPEFAGLLRVLHFTQVGPS